jgi:hypothetical protein
MKGKAWGALTLLLLILLVACAVWIGRSSDHSQLRWQFAAIASVLVALCVVAGVLVNGRPEGILINDRNRMSLARVQWIAWIIVLLGAYFVEAVWNVAHSGDFPDMQTQLFGLLGIASVSPIVSSLIVDAKKRSPVIPTGQPDEQQALQPLAAGDFPGRKGAMDVNYNVSDASWGDLYLGEEVANRYVVDVARLQKLIITALLILAYLIHLWKAFSPDGSGALDMPGVGTTFLGLLGVSHGAYLADKATPKTPS